jgi:hypothetical protein
MPPAFVKAGLSTLTKQPRGHNAQSRSFNKKAAIRTRLRLTGVAIGKFDREVKQSSG